MHVAAMDVMPCSVEHHHHACGNRATPKSWIVLHCCVQLAASVHCEAGDGAAACHATSMHCEVMVLLHAMLQGAARKHGAWCSAAMSAAICILHCKVLYNAQCCEALQVLYLLTCCEYVMKTEGKILRSGPSEAPQHGCSVTSEGPGWNTNWRAQRCTSGILGCSLLLHSTGGKEVAAHLKYTYCTHAQGC
jgi:hypothetical protein